MPKRQGKYIDPGELVLALDFGLQCTPHMVVYNLMHFFISLAEIWRISCPVELLSQNRLKQVFLAGIKRLGEATGAFNDWWSQTASWL